MKLLTYDIILLAVFVIFIAQFLYRNRKNLNRDGLLFLYRTKWGMKVIDKIGKKYKKTLGALSYVSIGLGYVLMAGMLWLFGKLIYIYAVYPNVVQAIKVPPIMPLIPYLPQAFKLDFLPPFYFTYWIVILAIIAISHEFFHGIFMRRYGIKIKSTGFGFFPFFLPVFLAAFVEQDEKDMEKKSNFKQMAVLSAGTFANVLTGVLFFVVMVLFFALSFSPSGVSFDSYAYDVVQIAGISMINNISLENPSLEKVSSMLDNGLNEVKTEDGEFLLTKEYLEKQRNIGDSIFAYYDSPAIRNNLSGVITEINGVKIKSIEKLGDEINSYSPGDKVTLSIYNGEDTYNQDIVFAEYPGQEDRAWLGVSFSADTRKGLVKWISSFKNKNVFYLPNFDAAEFIYNLLWWLVLISFSVALVNMLPMGIFDGGRFFYLTILSLTKSEKKAEKWFKGVTKFLLFLVVLIMLFWAWSFF